MFGRPTGCIDQLTLVERAAIVTLHGVGWTGRDIAQELHCDENTVTRWVHRWQETRSLEDAERSGRPRCTTDDTDQDIMLHSDAHVNDVPRTSACTGARRALRAPSVGASTRSICTAACSELSMRTYRARLAFAEGYVLDGGRLVARAVQRRDALLSRPSRPRVRAASRLVQHSIRSTPERTMSGSRAKSRSGAASVRRTGPRGAVRRTWTRGATRPSSGSTSSPLHVSSGRAGSGGSSRTTASQHTAGTSRAWFHNHGVDLIDWPAWSPDLNPIEELWNDLKRRVYGRHPHSMEELERYRHRGMGRHRSQLYRTHLPQHASPLATCH